MSKSKTQETKSVAAQVRNIPLDQLVPSKANVRRVHPVAVIEARAASIFAHGLLQNLVVRAERDDAGAATGKFEVTAGRGRLAALKLLTKRKKIAKDAPISCNVREDGIAEELSLAENFSREALHPADEFEAFHALHRDKGMGAEDIAARFGTTTRHVRQRLKLGSVSPNLIALYRADAMTLEQLMAFTVCDDPKRQEEIWNGLSWNKTPDHIRSLLLSQHIAASDKRARFVGLAAYEAAGGTVLRDLFSEDDDGYLTDGVLIDRLAREKLESAAETVRVEGWKWVEVAADFPHGHGFARFYEREVALGEADAKKVARLEGQIEACERSIEEDGADAVLEAKLEGLQSKLAAYDSKRFVFDPDAVAQGGAFVVIGHDGEPEIVRGLIRPEDQRNAEGESDGGASEGGHVTQEEAGMADKPGLSDKLTAYLTAHRTMALRDALAKNADMALAALTHALVLQHFYDRSQSDSCLDIAARSPALTFLADGIEDSVAGRAVASCHEAWARRLPQQAEGAWAFVLALSAGDRLGLFAHCVALSVDAVERSACAAATRGSDLAQSLSLDMTTYWQPTAANYFGRVSKAKIVEAVEQAGLPDEARRIGGYKKADMAKAAEQLLTSRSWLPDIHRTKADAVIDPVMAQAAE